MRPAEEIGQTCLAARLRLLNRVVTSIYDEALRPLGLRASQLNVLVIVDLLGPARQDRICRMLRMDKSTLSRNVERMRVRGWLRVAAGGDARTRELSLTAAGRRLVGRALPAWRRAQARAEEALGAALADAVTQAANRLWFTEG